MPCCGAAAGRAPWVAAALIALVFAAISTAIIVVRTRDRSKAAALTAQDASHYVHMARVFRSGDWSLSFLHEGPMPEKGLAHRQFLYPVFLAGALALRDGLVSMALVNVGLGVLAILAFSRVALRVFPPRLALVATAGFGLHPFLIEYATKVLMSEVTFIAAAVFVYLFVLRGQEKGRWWHGLAAGAFGGLSYLARPTGLFLSASVLLVLGVQALRRRSRRRVAFIGTFLIGLVVLSSPSWIARLHYHGNPIYHGYLPNFMWHDVFEEAQAPGPPRYGPADYFATHTLGDAVGRFVWGAGRVMGFGSALVFFSFYGLWMFGLLATLLERRLGLLTALMGIQLLPFAWTARVNPSIRLYYAPMLPFLALYFTVGLVWAGRVAAEAGGMVFGRRGPWPARMGGAAVALGLLVCGAEAAYWMVCLATVA